MPPRRSCFSASRSGARSQRLFQCHHGVPASVDWAGIGRGIIDFQCHHGVPASDSVPFRGAISLLFQCHHGVPASQYTSLVLKDAQGSFNATTAFLLRGWEDELRLRPGRVSMPPRRSCFPGSGGPSWPSITRFNATTAFLLPRSRAGGVRRQFRVSMPPRRSCFFPAGEARD